MLHSLGHKILLVVAVCASIALLGFFALYWLTLKQNRSLEQHRDLPAISMKWFTLNNGIHQATRAQYSWLNSGDVKFRDERNQTWITIINPSFEQLGLLYKKSRVWEIERSVERRAFYDLRLMILALENLHQEGNSTIQNKTIEEALHDWSTKEWPLVQEINSQIEIIIRWQIDFSQQQALKLQQGIYELGIWIWIVASIVLLLVLVISMFFAKRITAPLRQLRVDVQNVINKQYHQENNHAIAETESTVDFAENEDEVQMLTEIFQKMEAVIQQRTELLESSNRQLDEANRAKGMYLTNMSHELRTPLNAIIGFAEVLLESNRDEKLSAHQIDRLGRILKSGQHLLELINSLLDLSKIEAGQMELEQTNFQLKNLIHDVMESLEPLLQEKSLKHELSFQADQKFLIYADSGKVRQILINLLGNAIKFTDPGGLIKISCSQDKSGIYISVQDNGCGMSEVEQQYIFEVFQQARSSGITQQKGTGLGLALVQSLMELLNGSVSLKSAVGEGSTFTLYFPKL